MDRYRAPPSGRREYRERSRSRDRAININGGGSKPSSSSSSAYSAGNDRERDKVYDYNGSGGERYKQGGDRDRDRNHGRGRGRDEGSTHDRYRGGHDDGYMRRDNRDRDRDRDRYRSTNNNSDNNRRGRSRSPSGNRKSVGYTDSRSGGSRNDIRNDSDRYENTHSNRGSGNIGNYNSYGNSEKGLATILITDKAKMSRPLTPSGNQHVHFTNNNSMQSNNSAEDPAASPPHTHTATTGQDDEDLSYDAAELEQIDAFLNQLGAGGGRSGSSTSGVRDATNTTGTMASTSANGGGDDGDDGGLNIDDLDDFLVVVPSKEAEEARLEREAIERKQRLEEIARKYNNNSNNNNNNNNNNNIYNTAAYNPSTLGGGVTGAPAFTELRVQHSQDSTITMTSGTSSLVPDYGASSSSPLGGSQSQSQSQALHTQPDNLHTLLSQSSTYGGSSAVTAPPSSLGGIAGMVYSPATTMIPQTQHALANLAIADDNSAGTSAGAGSGAGAGTIDAASSSSGHIIRPADVEAQQLQMERSALQSEQKSKKEFVFDMFSASPSDFEKMAGAKATREQLLEGEDPHLQSNWDDGEGYYKARIGELVGDRFKILGVVGKGVFSTVLKCVDTRVGDGASHHVAVKIIRNNDVMRKAAEKEMKILLALSSNDPDSKRFCVRLLTHLDYRSHVALVFEFQQMNLREALKKFGNNVGINIGAIRMYGRQLFVALRYLMELKVIHADIKLDNILCSGDLKQVKLCDFGSAFFETDTDAISPTPYLVSRFYRAPEIILGLQYDRALDLWSVAVCLYELFTGHVMFPGRTNNEMLRLQMAIKGRFPNKMLKSHARAYEEMGLEPHFDPDTRFRNYEQDALTGKSVLRLVDINLPTRDLPSVIRGSKAGADDPRLVSLLTDLLDKSLVLDPSKRLNASEGLRHPFFTAK